VPTGKVAHNPHQGLYYKFVPSWSWRIRFVAGYYHRILEKSNHGFGLRSDRSRSDSATIALRVFSVRSSCLWSFCKARTLLGLSSPLTGFLFRTLDLFSCLGNQQLSCLVSLECSNGLVQTVLHSCHLLFLRNSSRHTHQQSHISLVVPKTSHVFRVHVNGDKLVFQALSVLTFGQSPSPQIPFYVPL